MRAFFEWSYGKFNRKTTPTIPAKTSEGEFTLTYLNTLVFRFESENAWLAVHEVSEEKYLFFWGLEVCEPLMKASFPYQWYPFMNEYFHGYWEQAEIDRLEQELAND